MSVQLSHSELWEQSDVLIAEARALSVSEDANAETHEKVLKMIEDAKGLRARSKSLAELEAMAVEAHTGVETKKDPPGQEAVSDFKSWGDYLYNIWKVSKFNEWHPSLKKARLKFEDDPSPAFDIRVQGWVETQEQKTMTEAVGADGGFIVFPEYRTSMFMLSEFTRYVESRALVLPMKARQVIIPSLDQSGTTSGESHLYGGIVPAWTEEATEKDEEQPSLRQIAIVAHKLALYTEASDELLADSALQLEALLYKLFSGATANEKEWAYINGSGAGQPLGIAHAASGATYRQTRATATAIGITDVFNMLSHFLGQSPIWLAHQSTMPQILAMNGPSGNASYVWIGNGRDQMPTTLMGYPIFFIENCATLGSEGDLILADWSKYVIGNREPTTINSSSHFKFRDDLTAWRCVSRVGGRPWLSDLLTLRDGSTEVSPFVILDDGVTPT